jgi:hypothetical protein
MRIQERAMKAQIRKASHREFCGGRRRLPRETPDANLHFRILWLSVTLQTKTREQPPPLSRGQEEE